jgi:hypothetical protein
MGLLRAGIATFIAALALAPAAQGAQRYAAPAGSGNECTQAQPCLLSEAVGKAESNDEVIVTPGTYALASKVATPLGKTGIDIHGEPGQPVPRLVAASAANAVFEVGAENRLSQVDLENTGNLASGIVCNEAALVDRVRVLVAGESSWAVQQHATCVVRDSLLRAEGEKATGLLSSGGQETALARNLTVAVSGAESIGITSEGFGFNPFGATSHLLDVQNSIVHADGTDLTSTFFYFPGPPFTIESAGDIAVGHSNFASSKSAAGSTITEGTGNQKAPPLFVDAAGANYREAAGSPTIDAGAADAQIGSLDLAGNPRILGSAPDIGAYEFVPPAVLLATAGTLQSLSLSPSAFRPAKKGEAIFSARKKRKAPIGTTVTYSLSAAGTVEFSAERRLPGRKVGKRCVKQTRANRTKKKCSRFKRVKGGFTHSGQGGQNRFKFSGRIAGKGLKPGRYRLTGKTGSVSKRASFRIVR